MKISKLRVNVSFAETKRESAGPLARSSTELTRSSTAAKSSQRPDYQILTPVQGAHRYEGIPMWVVDGRPQILAVSLASISSPAFLISLRRV